jgi:hypothetical protein
MTKEVLIALSIVMIAFGLVIYASGDRTRKSLDVPLLSRHSMFFLDGILALFGLLSLTVLMLVLR